MTFPLFTLARTLVLTFVCASILSLSGAQTASTDSSPPPPPVAQPPIPLAKSPVAVFRELLAMAPVERKEFLANRPPENQKMLQRKLREYEALEPNEREWRLQATELRYYLVPLMALPATNRSSQLKLLPPTIRPLVVTRLRAWDSLPHQTRSELLENEAALRYFTAADALPRSRRQGERVAASGPGHALEASVARWRALPAGERLKTQKRFNLFFELSPQEKQRAMRSLSEEERRQIDETLQVFGSLPPAQRVECIRAFDSFAGLSPQERLQFLRNAERWSQMSPDERNAWRELVNKLSQRPPLPPVPAESAPVLPGAAAAETQALATNL